MQIHPLLLLRAEKASQSASPATGTFFLSFFLTPSRIVEETHGDDETGSQAQI